MNEEKSRVIERLKKLRLGYEDGTCLCDFCNRELRDGEEIRILYGKLDMSEEEYQESLRRIREFFGAKLIVGSRSTVDIWASCTGCIGDWIDRPTRGTDEWLFKATLKRCRGGSRLENIEVLCHSPPEEGT